MDKLCTWSLGLQSRARFQDSGAGCAPRIFGPDVMQSGFGVNFLFWSGELQENCRRISQRILMANFDSEIFGLVFPGLQVTPKIHAQNCRHSSPISRS